MDVWRERFDEFYRLIKPRIFKMTARNPEWAHHLFFWALKTMGKLGVDKLVLDNKTNRLESEPELENAAGFYKNAEIHPRSMRLLGFDSVVVGTVTGDSWKGNKFRPRIWRFPGSEIGGTSDMDKGRGSLINCMGLPGVGADKVARRLEKYGDHGVSLTINLMATPGKEGNEILEDLAYTVSRLRNVLYVKRFELNISCPNTHGSDGKGDARADNLSQLGKMLGIINKEKRASQGLYVKVSSDSSERDADDVVSVGRDHGVMGYVTGNTTTVHDPKYITRDITSEIGRPCGASGDAVWEPSKRVQGYFADRVGDGVKLIACGGINSVERMNERLGIGDCDKVQIFTGLIYDIGLLGKLRAGD